MSPHNLLFFDYICSFFFFDNFFFFFTCRNEWIVEFPFSSFSFFSIRCFGMWRTLYNSPVLCFLSLLLLLFFISPRPFAFLVKGVGFRSGAAAFYSSYCTWILSPHYFAIHQRDNPLFNDCISISTQVRYILATPSHCLSLKGRTGRLHYSHRRVPA